MCVIIAKPNGAKMPTDNIIEKCFNANSHGAGYMLALKDSVIIRKGFMSVKDLKDDLKVVSDNFDIKDFTQIPMVFHFRISTQGGVQRELCHPYAVCNNYATMRKLKNTCDMGLAHNGIISLTSEYSTNGELKYNDTMTFIKDYLSLIVDNDMYFTKNKNKLKLIKNLIGVNNKLAILNKKGFISLIGAFTKYNGLFFSNMYWRYSNTAFMSDPRETNDLDKLAQDDGFKDFRDFEDYVDREDNDYRKVAFKNWLW